MIACFRPLHDCRPDYVGLLGELPLLMHVRKLLEAITVAPVGYRVWKDVKDVLALNCTALKTKTSCELSWVLCDEELCSPREKAYFLSTVEAENMLLCRTYCSSLTLGISAKQAARGHGRTCTARTKGSWTLPSSNVQSIQVHMKAPCVALIVVRVIQYALENRNVRLGVT
jgi:hypothetical protein